MDKNNKINENTKIYEIDIVKNTNFSKYFKDIFQDKQDEKEKKHNDIQNINLNVNFNVGKITNIFDIFIKLIFKYVKADIEKYQVKNENEKLAYNLDDKDMDIKKEDLASAIRQFITLVLYREREDDKVKKIKMNEKNIIDYLKNKDLWKSTLYNNQSRFEADLLKLKGLNIKIKEILFFYYYIKGFDEFENEIINSINEREEKQKKKIEIAKKIEEEKAKQNGKNDNDGNDNFVNEEGNNSGDESDDSFGYDDDGGDEDKKKKKKHDDD